MRHNDISMTDMSDFDTGDNLYHVRKSRLIRLINWWQVRIAGAVGLDTLLVRMVEHVTHTAMNSSTAVEPVVVRQPQNMPGLWTQGRLPLPRHG